METRMPNRHQTALTQIRKASSLTQAQVADYLGVSKATYSAWETGRAELGAERLIALSDLFRCTPNDILRYNGTNESFSVVSSAEKECIQLFRSSPPNIRQDVLDIMRTTVKGWRLR